MEVSIPGTGQGRATPAALALGSLAACFVVAAVDPQESGAYPACPTRALLGFDCPACGTLRGLHALAGGRVWDALGHNVLLALAVPVGLVVWVRWVAAALGRPAPAWRLPAWAPVVLLVAAVAFAVVRNLPGQPFEWLASG